MSLRAQWTVRRGRPVDPALRPCRAAVFDLPAGARVLELGCCETNFSHWLRRADPTLRITGVDVNVPADFSGTFVQKPAESCDFDPASFEAVILLGSLEHFGLGFYGDPKNEDADIETLLKVRDWLVPGGWVYYDVPWTPRAHYVTENRHFRVYSDDTLPNCEGLDAPRAVLCARGGRTGRRGCGRNSRSCRSGIARGSGEGGMIRVRTNLAALDHARRNLLTREDLAAVGQMVRQRILERTARGVDVGAPVPGVLTGYAQAKRDDLGSASPVNLMVSGEMLRAITYEVRPSLTGVDLYFAR